MHMKVNLGEQFNKLISKKLYYEVTHSADSLDTDENGNPFEEISEGDIELEGSPVLELEDESKISGS